MYSMSLQKLIGSIENRWRLLVDLIVDLRERNIHIPEKFITSVTCCRSLINSFKYSFNKGSYNAQYSTLLSQTIKELLEVESGLIVFVANVVGEDYALEWSKKLNGVPLIQGGVVFE